jgi:hypothetical protein
MDLRLDRSHFFHHRILRKAWSIGMKLQYLQEDSPVEKARKELDAAERKMKAAEARDSGPGGNRSTNSELRAAKQDYQAAQARLRKARADAEGVSTDDISKRDYEDAKARAKASAETPEGIRKAIARQEARIKMQKDQLDRLKARENKFRNQEELETKQQKRVEDAEHELQKLKDKLAKAS